MNSSFYKSQSPPTWHRDDVAECEWNQPVKTEPIFNDKGKLIGRKLLDKPFPIRVCHCPFPGN